ncbi:MAG TPA: hypothetical protein PKO21_01665 [Verrucomicrobiota bacterium]|nr:hypothetical protein [Verrucomicrobiota bacterium]
MKICNPGALDIGPATGLTVVRAHLHPAVALVVRSEGAIGPDP